jgi:predicted ATPase
VVGSTKAAHVPTLANSYSVKAEYDIFRGDVEATLVSGKVAFEYCREHDLGHYLPMARVRLGWACARHSEREAGLSEMRQGLADHIKHGNRAWVPFFHALITDVEAEAESAEGALARIDEALAIARQTGEHWTDSFLQRIRGEVLLKRNPSEAEEAFLAAIAVAQQQKAKSFQLQAALPLAKLYQSNGRPAGAQAVLSSALGGLSSTSEFPEIEEAQALLYALPL